MPSLLPGAEPYSAAGGDVGVLVVHGFTGNPSSMRPLAERLAEAGFAVQLPRLPGHGTSWRQLQRTRWQDWVREARAALTVLRAHTERQLVVGLSMGGTIALHLLETEARSSSEAVATKASLAGGVLINPSVDPADPRLRALPAVKWLVPSLRGLGNDIAKPDADEQPYPRVPLKALASVVGLQRSVREHLHVVHQPLLVLTSAQDHVVDPAESRLVVERVASTDVTHITLERSYHVATLDYDADEIAERTLGFARRVTGAAADV